MSKLSNALLFLLISFPMLSQKNDSIAVNFKVNFDQFPLEFNKSYVSAQNDTIQISSFKCYLSGIEIHYTDKTVFIPKTKPHLLDYAIPNSMQLALPNQRKTIAKVCFNIGIDSVTNTSGALDGDLDPIKGMYWAWQSGYINLKIEGQSSSCQTRKNQFQFHLGGYQQPYYNLRRKEINVKSQDNSIDIVIDLAVFFAETNLSKTNAVMTPGNKAMELADISAKMFFAE
ncbi:MbnP family protein [Flavobacterium mekongense]|uniref:MbnP family protein n=1 Tax=Flavobacterium mekongense TaxID=3379707 RepID=UPI00399A4C06